MLQVRRAPDPDPGAGEVRIRVVCAGINFADILARLGLYPDAPKLPAVVGYEVSGVVDAVGEGADKTLLNRRVVALTSFGGYSDTVCARSAAVFLIPNAVSDEAAAAIPVTYLTASTILLHQARISNRETVLVHGAAGGVGVAAIQLCRIVGARVIGTASRPKHDYLRSLDVTPIDYRDADWPSQVMKATDGRGVDLAMDPIGGRSFQQSYDVLAPGGRLCCFGLAAAVSGERRKLIHTIRTVLAIPKFRPISLMQDNRGVFGVNLGRLWGETEMMRTQMQTLLDYAATGQIDPPIDSVHEFADAADAHRRIQDRKNVGKVLLKPS